MKKFAAAALVLAITAGALRAADVPEFPKPVKEHEWLQKFVGEWEGTSECNMPGQPPMKGTSLESVKPLGGFWVVANGQGDMGGMKMEYVMTLGYSPEKQKYVGTWTDSMMNHLWQYEGTVDATGTILTLEATGPNMMKPGTTAKYRDVTEFKSNGERLFSSYVQDEKGEWVQMATGVAKRKK